MSSFRVRHVPLMSIRASDVRNGGRGDRRGEGAPVELAIMSIHPKPINPIRRCFSSPPACTHTRTNDTARHARWLPPGLHPAVAATAIQLLIIIWRPFLSKRNPYRTSSRYLTEGHLFGL
ncbi:Uncharacterized protein FWK35_00024332 [Aphis craccivora]|uniref:Uncharacterized protein n=1 Tax=Aphis craccivora TaxID=307492 RepID=A0A6G0ZGT7_APHCR|nr:Uncharacterized protein FWK35_00024332 [Aphis craccivora]